MRVMRVPGLLGMGPQIQKSWKARPDGLLGGTGFWPEAHFRRGGIDAVYDDVGKPAGLARFAPATPARGVMFSARHRAGRDGQALTVPPVVPEDGYDDPADAAEPKGPDHAPAG